MNTIYNPEAPHHTKNKN